jgi:hypothetical protein
MQYGRVRFALHSILLLPTAIQAYACRAEHKLFESNFVPIPVMPERQQSNALGRRNGGRLVRIMLPIIFHAAIWE